MIPEFLSCLPAEIVHLIKGKSNVELFGVVSAAALCSYVVRKVFWTPFKLYFLAQYLPGLDLRKMGRWAVVTGATDGIGKEFARALASRGLDIILISRSEEKLNAVKQEIVQDFQRTVKIIQADFMDTDIYDKIEKELSGMDIAVLVNNVGMAQTYVHFLETPNLHESNKDILSVNCLSMASMTGVVLPQMLERRRGVVINISSILSYMGSTHSSNYSATKAYNLVLSRNLSRTYKSRGVIIQSLTPGMIRTSLLNALIPSNDSVTKSAGVKYMSTSVQSYVKSALNTIGWSDECHGHHLYYFLDFLLAIIPHHVLDKMAKE